MKQASADLHKITADIAKLSITIDKFNAALDDPESNVSVLSRKIGEAEDKLTDLQAKKESLFSKIEEAREKSASLYTEEALLDLIRQSSPAANEVRFRLRNEIKRRVTRIGIKFSATGSRVARVSFVNGATKWIIFQGDGAALIDPEKMRKLFS